MGNVQARMRRLLSEAEVVVHLRPRLREYEAELKKWMKAEEDFSYQTNQIFRVLDSMRNVPGLGEKLKIAEGFLKTSSRSIQDASVILRGLRHDL